MGPKQSMRLTVVVSTMSPLCCNKNERPTTRKNRGQIVLLCTARHTMIYIFGIWGRGRGRVHLGPTACFGVLCPTACFGVL